MRCLLLLLLLSASSCETTGPLRGSGEIAPTPAGHAKLCAEQPTFPGCPK